MPVKNSNLLAKAAADERRRRADLALRAASRVDPGRAVRRLADAADPPAWVPAAARRALTRPATRAPLLRLIAACGDRSDLLGRPGPDDPYLPALAALAGWADAWVRDPADWRPASHNRGRQLGSLARHLLARYPVPAFMDGAWTDAGDGGRSAEQGWFAHLGGGGNLRKADGLPFPLTKMAAHHALLAPAGTVPRHAIVWGWARALGAAPRLADAVVAAGPVQRLGDPSDVPAAVDALPFWASVVRLLAAHDVMPDLTRVGPIVDYLHHQRFVPADRVATDGVRGIPAPPQPGLSMVGRDLGTLVEQTEAWHRRLARARGGHGLTWSPSGIAGLDRVEGTDAHARRFVVTELLDGAALRAEGAAMHHCVFTYARQCQGGRAAIFSLRVDRGGGPERLATVEVNTRTRQVVQARGPCNRPVPAGDARVLRAWVVQARLTVGRTVAGLAD